MALRPYLEICSRHKKHHHLPPTYHALPPWAARSAQTARHTPRRRSPHVVHVGPRELRRRRRCGTQPQAWTLRDARSTAPWRRTTGPPGGRPKRYKHMWSVWRKRDLWCTAVQYEVGNRFPRFRRFRLVSAMLVIGVPVATSSAIGQSLRDFTDTYSYLIPLHVADRGSSSTTEEK